MSLLLNGRNVSKTTNQNTTMFIRINFKNNVDYKIL